MASETEPAKLLLPYLQRADELQKHEPLVAYYCRLYAMEKGLKIPQSERTKTTNALLISLMNQLEKDKKSIQLGPEDNLHVEGFALNVFGKADKQDRAGRADLNTAKTFYAASIFFEILTQFGPLQPDIEQKQKYAVWKAADIRKALKEGRKPTAGPPSDEDDLSVPPGTSTIGTDLGTSYTSVASTQPDSYPSPQFHHEVNDKASADIPPSPQFHDNVQRQHSAYIPPTAQFHDSANSQHSTDIPPSPPYASVGYPSHDFHPPPPASQSERSPYPQPYHHPSYSQDPQQHLPQNYPSHDTSYSYPNFQSYPSFTESSLPSVPSNYPSYYQSSDSSYTPQSAPSTTSYPSTAQYSANNRNGAKTVPSPPPVQTYQYDSNYQPPPEKIAEAHKAARFAVGALAFDDVSVAVDYLRKSLELLTNPSSAQ